MRFSLLQERGALFNYPRSAPIAQLVEQLICNQWVGSSSLSGGTIVFKGLAEIRWAFCFFGLQMGYKKRLFDGECPLIWLPFIKRVWRLSST